MRILVLGGTQFVGRHIVEAALANGHEVSLFHRGKTNADLFPDAEHLMGDRDGDLAVLRGKTWDVVVDTSGYIPRHVRATASLLADAVAQYIFISTISLYADMSQPKIDEDSELVKLEDETVEEGAGTYGGLKALCEQAAELAMPERVCSVRPGIIVGPYDPTDRFTYWVHRISLGGDVLVPNVPDMPMQYIDARDLAAWIINIAQNRLTGIYNATGPHAPTTLQKTLASIQTVTHSDVNWVWVDGEFLASKNIAPMRNIPYWIPAEAQGAMRVDASRAYRLGLTLRSPESTMQDTLVWSQTRSDDHEWRVGLSPEQERELLQQWSTHVG